MGSRSDTAPEGRNSYLHYQDGVLTIHGKVFVSSSNNSPVHVSSGSLTVRGSGALSLYGMGVPALIVSTNAKIDFALTPNDSNEQLHISSNSCAAVRGDLTVSSGGRIVLSTSDFLNEDSTDVYNTIDGNADIQVESLLLHNETGGACVNGDLTVKAEKYCQIVNQSEDRAALMGGTYWIETSNLNMRSYCGPLVNGDLTCKGVESTDDLDGKLSIVGCTIGETPVVRGNITVLGGSLYLGNQYYFRDTTDERYTQFKDNMADGPILVGDLTLKNAERLNVSRKDAGTTPLITGDVTLTDCFDIGMNVWGPIDRGTGTGPAIKGSVTLNSSRLGIIAESSNDYGEINDVPGLVDCKLSMTNSIFTVYSRNNDITPVIDQPYEWHVDNYVSSKPVFIKSTEKHYTAAESKNDTSLVIRSGDKIGFRAAKLGGGYITGTALQPVTMPTYLIMEGDNFAFRKVPGYQEIVTQEEWGEHKGYGIPTGTDLTDYLTLDKPQGGIWKLTTAEKAYQDDTSIQLTISGTAGGTNCSDPVTLTISGTMLDSGEKLAVSPSKYTRWNITGSTTQATEYDLWVDGVQVTSRNQTDILNNGMASFDPQTSTLFLKNADLQLGIKDPVIKSELDALTLSVTGQNTLCCLEGVVIDAKRLTVMLTDADSSLTVRSNQALAFTYNPILPDGAELWSGSNVNGLSYTPQADCTANMCIRITLHKMQKTWIYDSEKHGHFCTNENCTYQSGMAKHDIEWEPETESYGTTPGVWHKACKVCAYRGASEEKPFFGPKIETTALPDSEIGMSYRASISVAEDASKPLTWSIESGALPDGLELNAETGEITGKALTEGTYTFTVKVQGAASPLLNATATYTIKVTASSNELKFVQRITKNALKNADANSRENIENAIYNLIFKAQFRPTGINSSKDRRFDNTEKAKSTGSKDVNKNFEKMPITPDTTVTSLSLVMEDTTVLCVSDGENKAAWWGANFDEPAVGPDELFSNSNVTEPAGETDEDDTPSQDYNDHSSSKAISVGSSANGSVTVSPKTASKGDTVTVTVRPDTGYMLGTITVTDQDGKELALTDMGNGTFTFPMPASRVMVKAVFQLITFTDVPGGSYYEEAVKWATDNAITKGMTDTTFGPDLICTRAQAVTFLWRAAGSPVPQSTDMPFTDIPSSAYYHDAVLWAVENGITTGTSAATFSPDATCSRAQIVTLLWRAQSTPATDGALPFTDVADDAYYADAVLWAVTEEVTKGTSDTTFSPDADCTRAQIVTFLWRALK